MQRQRRQFLIGLGATPLAMGAGFRVAWAQAPNTAPDNKALADFPDVATFRTGDLLWPKRRGAVVPRTRSIATAPSLERREWEAERQQLFANPAASGLSAEVAERLRTMSYEEFERVYFTTQTPPQGSSTSGTRSLSAAGHTITVGHVAMIEVDRSGIPHVVEATPHRSDGSTGGVLRTRYADWLKGFTDVQVWHGRFRGLDQAAARRVAGVAVRQLGKPYDFFNFNLNDDRGFYCSKLVWFSVWRAAHIAPDDNPDPDRGNRFPPWFSPKALIGASRVTLLHSPGQY